MAKNPLAQFEKSSETLIVLVNKREFLALIYIISNCAIFIPPCFLIVQQLFDNGHYAEATFTVHKLTDKK